MRKDALGFFWRDEPVIKVVKEKVLVTPPKATWLRPDYLPGIEAARALVLPEYTIDELVAATKEEALFFDIEIYKNYFLAGFMGAKSGKYVWVESDENGIIDIQKLGWILTNFETIGFNSIPFDLPITSMALNNCTTMEMKQAVDMIIGEGMNWREVMKYFKTKVLACNHIDLIEVAPLRGSLKIYNGRQHGKTMQDLPFPPYIELSPDQKLLTRVYCLTSDLPATKNLRETLNEQCDLRVKMSDEYKLDLRSKSDAQIAEAVIMSELRKISKVPRKQDVLPGTVYRYRKPDFLQFKTPQMQNALQTVLNAAFIVEDHGSFATPPQIDALDIKMGISTYKMGIGGLHSTEKKAVHYSDKNFQLWDFDVTSYYPWIIMILGLFPPHLGPNFLRVFSRIVFDRIKAKVAKLKAIANSLKIVVNGSYGKLGSKYSDLYAPDLLIQVTLTGQLSLLMLIEALECENIRVVSANTDGIVIKPTTAQVPRMHEIVKAWEASTKFEMEGTRYLGLFSRDVNNYIAVKMKKDKALNDWVYAPDGVKGKGAFANPWSHAEDKADWLHKNPANLVCYDAIEAYLVYGTPLEETITRCTDITKFVTIRNVTGGAVKVADNEDDNQFYGKSIRWYNGRDEQRPLVYALSGKKVPKSDGAVPCMRLPDVFPDDVDYDWYVREAKKILKTLGIVA